MDDLIDISTQNDVGSKQILDGAEVDISKADQIEENLQKYEQLFGADEDAFDEPTTTRKVVVLLSLLQCMIIPKSKNQVFTHNFKVTMVLILVGTLDRVNDNSNADVSSLESGGSSFVSILRLWRDDVSGASISLLAFSDTISFRTATPRIRDSRWKQLRYHRSEAGVACPEREPTSTSNLHLPGSLLSRSRWSQYNRIAHQHHPKQQRFTLIP